MALPQFIAGRDWFLMDSEPPGPAMPSCYGAGNFICVRKGSDGEYELLYSKDGINWAQAENTYGITNVRYTAKKFVSFVSGSADYILTSEDGINWGVTPMPKAATWSEIYSGAGNIIVLGSDDDGDFAVYSTDWSSWEYIEPYPYADLSCITYGNDMFLAVRNNGHYFVSSKDGITWEYIGKVESNNTVERIIYGAGNFVAVFEYQRYNNGTRYINNYLQYSVDGKEWPHCTGVPRYGNSSYHWNSLQYSDGLYVATANGYYRQSALAYHSMNKCLYSTNGIVWEEGTFPVSHVWNYCFCGAGMAFATNGGEIVYTGKKKADADIAENALLQSYASSWLCGEDGTFLLPPTLTFTFPEVMDGKIPGVTVTWSTAYNEWAAQFRVTAWHGDRPVFQAIGAGDSTTSVVEGEIQGYDRITIEIQAWNTPFRRARVESVIFGIQQVLGKSDIMNFSSVFSVDPLSAELPKNEITFELKNLGGRFNADNPNGMASYIMERQKVKARFGYKVGSSIEWIPGGVYYLSEWDMPQNGITATFTARNAAEYMEDVYSGPLTGSFYDIASAAFQQAGLPALIDGGEQWEIDNSLKRITPPANPSLSSATIAQVIQYIANAACCVVYQDRAGKWHITPIPYVLSDYSVDRFNSYEDSTLSLSKPLKAVEVNSGQCVYDVSKTGLTQPVSNPLISDKQAVVVSRWVADFLSNRRVLSGSFRADPRLDPLDIITNINKYSQSLVMVTEFQLTYNGAFRGTYEGRAVDDYFQRTYYYAGEVFAGEV